MKKVLSGIISTVFLIAVVACNNESKQDKKASSSQPAASSKDDSKKTEISLGPAGAEVKTRDADVKISTKDTTDK